MKSFKWFKEKNLNGQIIPPSREGLSVIYLPKESNLLIFGGISNTRMSDIYLYDLKTNQWKQIQTSGRQPSARCYHSMFYEDPHIFLYAGQGDKGRSLGDFYFLNVKNWSWKRLFLLESPPFRHSHTICEGLNEKEKIIFGGLCLPENILYNDVWTFNYSNLAFNSSLPEIPGAVCSLRKTKGEIPSARKGHSVIIYNKNMYLFGGKSAVANENTFIIHALSLESNIWKKVQTIGRCPTPRCYFTLNFFNQNRLIFFGGLDNQTNKASNETYLLYLDDLYWSAPFTAGVQPTPRYHHGSSIVKSENNRTYLIILGGLEQSICPMEICYLTETETKENAEWEKLKEMNEQEKLTSELAGNTVIDNKKYIMEIERLIMEEKMKIAENEKERRKFEQILDEKKKSIEDRYNVKIKEEDQIEQEKKNLLNGIETMFIMIKQEQMISKEIISKNKLLEGSLQNVQDFMINLDQFANAIMKSQFDENDPKEAGLKKLIDSSREDINKSREEHKESLYKLKKAYEKINSALLKNETNLDISKKNVLSLNKDYEQILLETENDE